MTPQPDLGDAPFVGQAFRAGVEWSASRDLEDLISDPLPPVLGLSDGNHASYVWDDDSHIGRSDRAFEIAEFCEHISGLDGTFDAEHMLDALELSSTEYTCIHRFRRLLALAWFRCGTRGPAGHGFAHLMQRKDPLTSSDLARTARCGRSADARLRLFWYDLPPPRIVVAREQGRGRGVEVLSGRDGTGTWCLPVHVRPELAVAARVTSRG
ncbi:hypothetical protein [Herbidospora cretacea]|uniref:hypothetical protein n=1 Tax=Herbidospora cretacea TaxID=28444 RepID=UPI00068FC601|nr:hypothetical protein [Herbidospora cretacea]